MKLYFLKMSIDEFTKDRIESIPANPSIGHSLFGSRKLYKKFNEILRNDLENGAISYEKYNRIAEKIFNLSTKMVRETWNSRARRKFIFLFIIDKYHIDRKYGQELGNDPDIRPYMKSAKSALKYNY